jgi:hypothetical protein
MRPTAIRGAQIAANSKSESTANSESPWSLPRNAEQNTGPNFQNDAAVGSKEVDPMPIDLISPYPHPSPGLLGSDLHPRPLAQFARISPIARLKCVGGRVGKV